MQKYTRVNYYLLFTMDPSHNCNSFSRQFTVWFYGPLRVEQVTEIKVLNCFNTSSFKTIFSVLVSFSLRLLRSFQNYIQRVFISQFNVRMNKIIGNLTFCVFLVVHYQIKATESRHKKQSIPDLLIKDTMFRKIFIQR